MKIKSTYSYFSSTRNGLPTSTVASTIGLESPFQPFKVTSPMAPPAVTSSLNPLLGLPSPFPFLSAHGLSSLSDPKAAKGPLPPGLPPGFPGELLQFYQLFVSKFSTFCHFSGMMDIHSTQALLNLARSGNFLPPTSGGSSAFSPPSNLEAAVKKRPATSEALDLSPPTVKKAKIEAKPTSSAPPSADPTIINWSVSEVCQFVASIDICKEYTEVSLQFSPFSKKCSYTSWHVDKKSTLGLIGWLNYSYYLLVLSNYLFGAREKILQLIRVTNCFQFFKDFPLSCLSYMYDWHTSVFVSKWKSTPLKMVEYIKLLILHNQVPTRIQIPTFLPPNNNWMMRLVGEGGHLMSAHL